MPYESPGVYVEEISSGAQPVAPVGTSTAGFVGVVPNSLTVPVTRVVGESVGSGDGSVTEFALKQAPVLTSETSCVVRVDGVVVDSDDVTVANADGAASVTLGTAPADGATVTVDYAVSQSATPRTAGEPVLCTNFGEYRSHFGGFALDSGTGNSHRNLAHSVAGFFNNGGSRCYVMRYASLSGLSAATALEPFEAIDEIALVSAPGVTDATVQSNIVAHCEKMGDRFAVLDSALKTGRGSITKEEIAPPAPTNYAAFYFPWITVFDGATKINDPSSDGRIAVAPSGHVTGVYARVDNRRGVHKAPANESIVGALDVSYHVGRPVQDGLDPHGINCIRKLNDRILIWGARTIGGNANGEWKYVNVRRLFLFLRESIDESTQWTVFEPNTPELWAKIRRTVNAFLTNVWRDGALFGATADTAFYVKCDEETNPPEVRDLGRVVTEIGVAPAKPAEFVIFRISQWAGQDS